MKFIDTFSGIGGFAKPLIEAGHECVGFSEINKWAIQVYQNQFPDHHFLGDITKIDADRLPDFDLLVGGFPCQSFSMAGKRGGFDDTRGTLFFELARILKAKRPKWYIFENVKGLISHDNGKTLGTIMQTLWELGYTADYQVLNSKDFGVAQNRERVFIVGTIAEECGTLKEFWHFDYPKKFDYKVKLADILEDEVDEKYYLSEKKLKKILQAMGSVREPTAFAERGRYNEDGKVNQIIEPRFDGLTNTLTSVEKDNQVFVIKRKRNEFGKAIRKDYESGKTKARLKDMRDWQVINQSHSNTLTGVEIDNLILVPEATKKGYTVAMEGDSINLKQEKSKTRRGRVGKGLAATLDKDAQQYTIQNSRARRFTPTEYARLQGFPDNWHEGLSDAQAYKCYGNAVTTKLIKALIKNL